MSKPTWESCGGLVICTKCDSDEMMWCDVPIKKTGLYKRETKCEGCGDRQTTKLEPPELPAPTALEKLSQAIAEGPGDAAVKTKLIGSIEAAGAGDLTTAGRLAAQAIEADKERTWVLDVPAALARCPECTADAMEVVNRRAVHAKKYRWHLRCTACGVPRIVVTDRTSAEEADAAMQDELASPGPKIELLDLGAIHPESIQPRTLLDLLAAGDYSRDMFVGPMGQVVNEQGQDWPALVVFRERGQGKVWLADGFHRSKAAIQAGMPAMQAEVRVGGKREALLHAVGANSRNGVRFTNTDKRRAVSLLFDDVVLGKKSDTEIAALCCVSQPFVSKMRAERRERDMPAEVNLYSEEQGEPRERDNGYGESEPEPLQFDIEETIAAKQRRQAEEEEEAAERAREAEEKRREQEQSDSWSTPPEFLETIVRPILEVIDLDAASNEAAQAVVQATRWISAEEDALTQEWEGRVWLNPPYSHPLVERFALKAIEEFKSGRVTQLLVLVNSSTSSAWWHALAKASAVIAFPLGRISFWSPHGLDGDANRSPSTLFYFGNRDLIALNHLRAAGYFATMNT